MQPHKIGLICMHSCLPVMLGTCNNQVNNMMLRYIISQNVNGMFYGLIDIRTFHSYITIYDKTQSRQSALLLCLWGSPLTSDWEDCKNNVTYMYQFPDQVLLIQLLGRNLQNRRKKKRKHQKGQIHQKKSRKRRSITEIMTTTQALLKTQKTVILTIAVKRAVCTFLCHLFKFGWSISCYLSLNQNLQSCKRFQNSQNGTEINDTK